MARRVALTIARIMLGILTLKVIYNDLCYSTPTYYILKTGIVVNKIYTKRLFTTTRMHSYSQYNVEKNVLISKS
jgi:hypothetical protein